MKQRKQIQGRMLIKKTYFLKVDVKVLFFKIFLYWKSARF